MILDEIAQSWTIFTRSAQWVTLSKIMNTLMSGSYTLGIRTFDPVMLKPGTPAAALLSIQKFLHVVARTLCV